MKIKRTLSLLVAACLIMALVPTAAFAAAPHCDKAADDCIVCKVAAMINALPNEVTIANAAAVTEQIHAIDRIKVELSDDEYLELLTLVEEGTNEQGQGLGIPKKYFDTLDALTKVGGGGSLFIVKKFAAPDGPVNVADAEVKLQLTNVATNAQQILTLSTLSTRSDTLSGVSGYYSEVEGGWQYKYLLPAGTYTIKEVSDSGATVNGSPFVTGSVTYTLNGQPLEEGAEIEIVNGGEYSVVVMNNYDSGDLTVKCVVESNIAEDADKAFAVTVSTHGRNVPNGTYGDVTFDDGVATFSLKNGESVIAKEVPATGFEYTVTVTGTDGFECTVNKDIDDSGFFSGDTEVTVTLKRSVYPVTITEGTAVLKSAGGAAGVAASNEYDFNVGDEIVLTADPAPAGQKFKGWQGAEGLDFTDGDANTSPATFKMPDKALNLTATYETDSTGGAGAGDSQPSRKDIKITYNGGNSFSTNKSEVPTAVEIDGVPVGFTGNGRNFTVSSIPAGADRITVRWNSTSASTNFKPDAVAYSFNVELPKTGDASILSYAMMAMVAAAGAMSLKK